MTKQEAILLATTFVLNDPELACEVDATKADAVLMPASLIGEKNDAWSVAFPYVSRFGEIDCPSSMFIQVDTKSRNVKLVWSI